MSFTHKKTLYIDGMHCPSCDILVKDQFSTCKNIQSVKTNYKKKTAEIIYKGNLSLKDLNKTIRKYGYTASEQKIDEKEPFSKRIIDAGSIALFIVILYFFAQQFHIIPDFQSSAKLTIVGALMLGLIASMSTCMATAGSLFLMILNGTKESERKTSPIVSAISFTSGRVLSYGVFGAFAGLIGHTITRSVLFDSALSAIIALIMITAGLEMAGILSSGAILGEQRKKLFAFLEKKLLVNPSKMSFLLGAITILLPCGFTQTVQAYSLSLANPFQSASVMIAFAVGTVPALLAVGFAASWAKTNWYKGLFKVAGVGVVLIGFTLIFNLVQLTGFSPIVSGSVQKYANMTPLENGVQVARMNVNSGGYSPTQFTVKKGIPVRWIVNGQNVFGCQGTLVVPKIGVEKTLTTGENVIEFTPNQEGPISFSCSMGMYRGQFQVVGS